MHLEKTSEMLGIMAALASAASWAFGTVVFERLGKHIPYAGITFLKGTFSIILMSLLALAMGDWSQISSRDAAILAASGIIGISIGDTLFFRSLQDLGAKTQVLYFLLGQVVTMLLSFMLLGEVLGLTQYIGSTVLLCGIVVVTWGRQDDHPNKMRGIIGGLASILCFSISTIMIKYTAPEINIVSSTLCRMFFGTLIITLLGVSTGKIKEWVKPLKDKRILQWVVTNVAVITIGGFVLSMYAVKKISVSLASVLSVTEPVFVLGFAYIINHEKASWREIVGASISVLGLLLIILNNG